jgi:hypothetical protein
MIIEPPGKGPISLRGFLSYMARFILIASVAFVLRAFHQGLIHPTMMD